MKPYRLFHNLSLDIVLGALGCSYMAARLFMASPGWSWWLSLGLTVWLLYMGDHLLDAWRFRKKSNRRLHSFVFTHRRILLWCMGVFTIVDTLVIFNFLGRTLLKYALGMAFLVLLFYATRHLLRRNSVLSIPGEFFVLAIYLAGTWLGPLLTRQTPWQAEQGMIGLMTAGVLMMNLGIISLYDVQLDTRLGISSLARRFGKRTTRILIIVTGSGIYLLGIIQFLISGTDRVAQFALLVAGMATLLFVILLEPSYFRQKEHFRMAADAVLYMGFLAVLIRP